MPANRCSEGRGAAAGSEEISRGSPRRRDYAAEVRGILEGRLDMRPTIGHLRELAEQLELERAAKQRLLYPRSEQRAD